MVGDVSGERRRRAARSADRGAFSGLVPFVNKFTAFGANPYGEPAR